MITNQVDLKIDITFDEPVDGSKVADELCEELYDVVAEAISKVDGVGPTGFTLVIS